MARTRSRAVAFLEYLLVRTVVCILQMLSLQSARRFAVLLARLAHRVDRRHRLVALDNLRHAYGDSLTEEERANVVRGVYQHFFTMLIEMIHFPRLLHPLTWPRYVDEVIDPQMAEMMLSKRPKLLVTGHFGNWEAIGYLFGLFGFETFAIARKLDNPYLDRFLREFRQRTGQHILDKQGDFDRIQGVLADGGILGTLGDQDAGQRGVFVEFFGRPASTHKAIALLALEYNVPILVGGFPRLGDPPRYRSVIVDLIDPAEYAGRPDGVFALTQRFTSALEQVIRVAPEQYFWVHRRWKHQPKQRKARKAA